MNYAEWEQGLPPEITGDVLWRVEAYRLALFADELAWHDATKLVRDRRTIELSDQLFSAVGSMGAHIAEGYSRSSGKDRVRFYEYALGSGREGRHWYCQGRCVLGDAVMRHRIELLTQIIRLLLKMIPDQRPVTIREETIVYETDLTHLLANVPFADEPDI